jgi:hypothetical protein
MRCWMWSETFAGCRYAHAASTKTRRAAVPGFGEIVIQTLPTRAGFVDEPQLRRLPLQAANQPINVGLACTDGPDEHRGVRAPARRVRHRDGILMHIQSDVERCRAPWLTSRNTALRLCSGAALASRLTREITGGQPVPEVILSRPSGVKQI